MLVTIYAICNISLLLSVSISIGGAWGEGFDPHRMAWARF